MATRRRRGHHHNHRIRIGASVAAAALTALALTAGRARLAAPAPRTAVLVTTVRPQPPAGSPTTLARHRASPTTRPARRATPTTTTTTTTARTTTTTAPPPPRQMPVETRTTCLALADANHYAVVVANDRWFEQQLHRLSPDTQLAARQRHALEVEEAQALTEIDAQYTIDRSNCYLDGFGLLTGARAAP